MGRGKIGSEEEETEDETEGQRADRAGLTRQAGLGPELGGVRRFRASCGFSWQAERSSTSALPGSEGLKLCTSGSEGLNLYTSGCGLKTDQINRHTNLKRKTGWISEHENQSGMTMGVGAHGGDCRGWQGPDVATEA